MSRLELPDDLLARVDLRRLYPDKYGNPVMVHCPEHEDTGKPNLGVYPHNVYCFHPQCGWHAGVFEYIKRARGLTKMREVLEVARQLCADKPLTIGRTLTEREEMPPMEMAVCEQYELTLDDSPELYDWLKRRYGITADTAREAHLGYTGEFPYAFTIPVFDLEGELVNIRFRADPNRMDDVSSKYWGIKGRNTTAFYFPPWVYRSSKPTLRERLEECNGKPTVFLTEGEMDALAFGQMGIAAISTTNGARAFQSRDPELSAALEGCRVLVAYDQDQTGVHAGQRVVRALREWGVQADMLLWPLVLGKDGSELLAHGFKRDDMRKFMKLVPIDP